MKFKLINSTFEHKHFFIHQYTGKLGAIFMEQNIRFGLILGQLAILKKKWAVKYANFEGGFLCFSGQNNNLSYFLNMVASVLQCCTIINIYFMNKMVFLMFFWLKIG